MAPEVSLVGSVFNIFCTWSVAKPDGCLCTGFSIRHLDRIVTYTCQEPTLFEKTGEHAVKINLPYAKRLKRSCFDRLKYKSRNGFRKIFSCSAI